MEVRQEEEGDRGYVYDVIRKAFGREDEAALVKQLREEGSVFLSMVACRSDKDEKSAVVGHIMFSTLTPTWEEGVSKGVQEKSVVLALAPLAVTPTEQRMGVGTDLVKHALEELKRRDEVVAIFLLGDPSFYGRFGFSSELSVKSVYSELGEAWMGLHLDPVRSAKVTYVTFPKAFSSLDEEG